MARASTRACTAFIMGTALIGAGLGGTPATLSSLGVNRLLGQTPMLPSRVYSALNSGIDCYRRGDFERAATFLQQAQSGQDCLSNDGKSELNTYLARNNAALQGRREGSGQLKKAEEAIQAGNFAEADALIKKAATNQYLTAADRLKAQQLAEQTRPSGLNNIAHKPAENPGVQSITLARSKLQQARTMMNKGDFDAAEALAREALQMNGMVYDMKEDTPGKLLEEISRVRGDPKAILALARAALQRGDFDAAEALALKAKAMWTRSGLRGWIPSFGSDTPDKVLRDIKDARMKGVVVQPTVKQVEPSKPKEAPSKMESFKNFFKGSDAAVPDKPEPAPKNDGVPQSKNPTAESTPVASTFKNLLKGSDAAVPEKPEPLQKSDAEPPNKNAAAESTSVATTFKNLFKGGDAPVPEQPEAGPKSDAAAQATNPASETVPQARKVESSEIRRVEFTTPASENDQPTPPPTPVLQPKPTTAPDLLPAPNRSEPDKKPTETKPEIKPPSKPAIKPEQEPESKPAAKPVARPAADSAAKPKTAGENARALLKQARQQLDEGNTARARQLVSEAAALKVEYNWWDDTPEKVTADIQRGAKASNTSAVAHSEHAPAANSADKKSATDDKKVDDKKPELVKSDRPRTKEDAKVMLGMARERFKNAQYEEAEMLACRAKQITDGWGLFEDSPDKLLLDVRRARDKVGRDESVKLMAEARKLFEQGKLDEARLKACRAERLHGPYSIWDMGDRPQKLMTQIEVAQVKKPKLPPPPSTPAAAALAAKDKDLKKPTPAPDSRITGAAAPHTNDQHPAVAGERARVGERAPDHAAQPPPPPTPVAAETAARPATTVNPIEEARMAEARRILVHARDFLKQGDFARARALSDQVEAMGVNLNRPGEDSPGAIRRDLQIAQAAKEQPDVIPIPVHPSATDPAKVWAKQLMAEVDRLQKEGKLIEARQKALVAVEAQRSGANFEEEDSSPERALLHLAGQATKKIEGLMNEAADYMATAAIDPSRYQKAEEDLQQAHQLALGFALDTQPIDNKLVSLRQTRDKSFAVAPAIETPRPDAVPRPKAAPLAEVRPQQIPSMTPGVAPLAEAKPQQIPSMTPGVAPLAEAKPPQVPSVAPLPGSSPLAEVMPPQNTPGKATATGTMPRLTAAQHQEPPDPRLHGLELLDKARLEIRNGKTVMARQLAEEAYKGEFGVQREAEIVLHTIDAEEFNQRRLVAIRSFQAANSALRRGETERARNMLTNLDYTLLEGDALARFKEIMRTPQMQPRAVAQAAPLPSLAPEVPGAGKASVSDSPRPAQLAPPADENFAGKVSAMQEIQFQKLREDNLRVQREAIERFRAGEPDRALEILQHYLGELSDCQLDPNRVGQLRRPVESRLEQFTKMKEQQILTTVKNDRKNSVGTIMANKTKADEIKQEKVAELMKQYHGFYKEAKYRDAEYAAMKAHELDPDNTAADAAIHVARIAGNQTDYKKIKDGKENMFLNVMNAAEDEGDFVELNKPVTFDEKRWKDISKRGKTGFGTDFTVKSEKDREIERRLTQPISFDFKNQSLKQVIEDLRDLSGVNVLADTRAIAEAGISLDQPLTMKLEQVSLKSALNLLLDKVKLGFLIKDEVLQITTADRLKGNLVARTFQVADIVIPVENYANNSPANLNNAIDRMSSQNRNGFSTGVAPYTGPNSMNNGTPTGSPGDSPGSLGTGPMGAKPPNGQQQLASAGSPGRPARQPGQTLEDVLIKLITNTIAPNSWAEMGGPGTIDYFPLGMALVVNQTPDIQEQIQELLQALRRLQDVEVAIEVRFITISESFYERIGLDFNVNVLTDTAKFEPQIVTGNFAPPTQINQFTPGHAILGITPAGTFTHDLDIPIKATSFGPATPPFGGFPIAPGADGGLSLGLAFLSDIQVFLFMEAAQGDRRTNVMQAPKLTMFNAQTATINVLDTVFFVTGNIIGLFNGQVIYNPQNQPFNIGLSLTLQPVVSADRRFVRVSLAPTLTNLTTPIAALFPITTVVTPVFDTGNVGQPVPITQYLQQPAFTTVGVQTTVSVPDGGTVLLGGLKTLREGRNEFGPPILSKMPYVNRLFKNVGYGRDAESLLLMVTPRIIINEEEEANFLRP